MGKAESVSEEGESRRSIRNDGEEQVRNDKSVGEDESHSEIFSHRLQSAIDDTDTNPSDAQKAVDKYNKATARFSIIGERGASHLDNVDGKTRMDNLDVAKGMEEARNAEKRSGFSEAKRRSTLLSKTEDVNRKEQISMSENGDESHMGSRTNNHMKEIGKYFENKELSDEEQTVVDVYNGKYDRQTIALTSHEGVPINLEMQQGNEQNAGTKHSIFRHVGKNNGSISYEEISLIPDVIKNGTRIDKGSNVVYQKNIDGVRYTVYTDKKANKEIFHDFYSNRKTAIPESLSGVSTNTQSSARTSGNAVNDANIDNTTETAKENDAKFSLRDKDSAPLINYGKASSRQEMLDMKRDIDEERRELATRYSKRKSLVTSGSYFSGGGLLEEGLKGIINPKVAVEYNEKIASVYADNHGNHIVTADVRNVDPRELVKHVDGEVQYFHASPVCKNFSKAKHDAGEVGLDIETAQSTADFINQIRPKVVTVENVKGYKGSESLGIILGALRENGYDYDVDVYNTADYGGYTNRERLIVRAVRDGKLPEKPAKLAKELCPKGWMEAVEDLIDTLPEKKSGVPNWMDTRLKAEGIDYRNIDKPLYVFGQGNSATSVSHASADELLPTLRTHGGDVIIMPDGRVLRATPRVLARITGLSDDYQMPDTDDMAHTIVGNGIPTQLSEHVIAPLLDSAFGEKEPANDEVRFSTSGRLNEKYGTRWIDEQTNEDGRHTTQVKNTINSYKKFGDWVKRDSEGRKVDVLDASSGLGMGTEWMRDNGINAEDVEPYPSENRTAPTYKSYDDIKKKYDYIISNAVLNVIPDDWRANVLHDMASKLKEGGKMVINVRSAESIRNQGKEGETRITLDDPSEILVLRPNGSIKAYQKGFTKAELKEWCENELGDGYSVEIANNKNAGGTYDTAVVVSKNNESNTIGVAPGVGHPRRSAQTMLKSDAKLANNSEIANGLDNISTALAEKSKMGAHEFLYSLSKAFGYKGNSLEKSFYKDLGNNVGVRIADHYGNAKNFDERGTNDTNYGVVVKLSPSTFKGKDNVDYLEYVYYPDKLDGARQKEIVDGLKDFLQTGDFSALPSPDRVNPSGRFKTEMSEDAPKFSLRNADSFMQDVSERGLGGVLGKANVDKLVDDLYMGNEGIRKEINEGIAKAGFDYRKATRNWIDGIVQGKVSPEAWHNVRTAVQKQLHSLFYSSIF